MYATSMSLGSIRLQKVRAYIIPNAHNKTICLPLDTHAYFIIPLRGDLEYQPERKEQLTVSSNQFIVCAGGTDVRIGKAEQFFQLTATANGSTTTHACLTTIESVLEHSVRSDAYAIVVSVPICDPFKFGLRNILPRFLHVKDLSAEQESSLSLISKLVVIHHQPTHDKSSAMLDRLTELLFLETIDYFFNSHETDSGVLKAMMDKRLRTAMSAIHEQPDSTWTVSKLARLASMSRSLFAEKFKSTIQETPLNYVRLCRIHKAKALLSESTASIDQVAQETGYSSVSSFVKAFSHVTGETPGRWRDRSWHEKA